jgi:hypothetical protein
MRTDSPEDRLLRLIKGKYGKKSETGQAPKAPGEAFITEASKKIFLKNKALRPIFSDSVNRFLILILILLAGYLAYSFLFPAHRDIDRFVEIKAPEPQAADIRGGGPVPAGDRAEDYAVYSRAIQGKNLFTAPFVEESRLSEEAPDIDISKRFNLVGIIAGERPEAIIEDKDAKKTHYLSEGQSLDGVTIVKIEEGKVILGYQGKEIVLVL